MDEIIATFSLSASDNKPSPPKINKLFEDPEEKSSFPPDPSSSHPLPQKRKANFKLN